MRPEGEVDAFQRHSEGETAEPSDGLDVGMRVGGGPGFSLGWLGRSSFRRENRKDGQVWGDEGVGTGSSMLGLSRRGGSFASQVYCL